MARFTVACVFMAALLVQPLKAATHYVGTCRTGSFQTISAAINDPNTVSGDTIDVCPGAYQEQVIISKSLTLQGIISLNSSSIRIGPPAVTPPAVLSSVLATALVPAIWVTATDGPVNIKNVTSPAFCSLPSGELGVAFYYASGTSGTLSHVRATGCGAGVWVENASDNIEGFTIANSVIDGPIICGTTPCSMKYGIVAASQQPPNTIPVLSTTISDNQIQEAVYGIYLSGPGVGTVSGNSFSYTDIVAAHTYGIYDLAPAVAVSNNTLIAVPAASAFTGVFIGAANASITNNKITSRIGVDFNCLPARVTGNTITAINGLYNVPGSFAGSNYFFNTATIRSGGC